MSDEKTYTLAEARREFAIQECATRGHSWSVVTVGGWQPVRIACDTCGMSGRVVDVAGPRNG